MYSQILAVFLVAMFIHIPANLKGCKANWPSKYIAYSYKNDMEMSDHNVWLVYNA